MPINVRIFEITLLPISKKPNATPELKVKYKSMKGRNSYDAPSINPRSAYCLVTISKTNIEAIVTKNLFLNKRPALTRFANICFAP